MIRAIIRDSHISTANTAETIAKVPSNAAIHMVESSRFAQAFAKLLILGLLVSIVAMLLLPWQQTSRGTGRVIAFIPGERPQPVQAPTKGIVLYVNPDLRDGYPVKEGQILLELQPEASDLKFQLLNMQTAQKEKLKTAQEKIKIQLTQIEEWTRAGEAAVTSAEQLVEAAKEKLESERELLPGKEAEVLQATQIFKRQKSLVNQQVQAKQELEKYRKDMDVKEAARKSTIRKIEALKQELASKKSLLKQKTIEAAAKVNVEKAKLEDARGLQAEADTKLAELDTKLNKLDRNVIRAPRDGNILNMPVFRGGQTVKEGEMLMTIVPEVTQKSVELMINGNDLPLVQIGQEVRLQFEGWPAVQFAGWPSIAIGTFSGRVATIDPTDNGKGEFRVMVLPNEELIEQYENQAPWPEDRFLRQGVRANGWVMLNRVSLGYEIWRQLNGFPVMLDQAPKKEDKTKPPKLPK